MKTSVFIGIACYDDVKLGIEMYANIGSETTHYGTYGWTGTFKDVLKKKES